MCLWGLGLKRSGFAWILTYTFRLALPSASLLNSKRPSIAHYSWHWNINQFSIAYPFRTLLRTRLTLRWRASRRKPWVYGVGDSHPNYRYSCLHAHLYSLQHSLPVYLQRKYNALLPLSKTKSKASVLILAPLYFPRRITRPVSYYAFFKGWLLLSQPPGCLSNFTSFST